MRPYSPAFVASGVFPSYLISHPKLTKSCLQVAMTPEISVCHPGINCALGGLWEVGSE